MNKRQSSNFKQPPEEKLKILFEYYQSGKYNDAINLAESILKKFPNNGLSWKILAGCLKETKRLEDSLSASKNYVKLQPTDAAGFYNLGNTLKDLLRYEEAKENYRMAINLRPEYPLAHYNLGVVFMEIKNYEEAIKFFTISKYDYFETYILRCLFKMNHESFKPHLDYMIKKGVYNSEVLSYFRQYKSRIGEKLKNTFSENPIRFVEKNNLINLCDFKTIFVKSANSILQEKYTRYKTQGLLTNGTQTLDNFFESDVGHVKDIKNIILSEIEKYRLKPEYADPVFLNNWPDNPRLNGWLISMDAGGKLDPHMHEKGWISGAVYINVPEKKTINSGNFVVSLNDSVDEENNQDDSTKIIDIFTGDIVLFPSTLYHYTIPFDSGEKRIVLAFDLIPD